MTIVMFDAVTISEIPKDATAVAGYVGGRWPTYATLVSRFPHAHHLSIAIRADEDAECLDVENGDAVPADAPGWFARQVGRGVSRPCFYADVSTMPAVLAELGKAGIQRADFRVWTAHFTGKPHIEPGSDATQWTDRALLRSLDESECDSTFFTAAAAAKPAVNKPRYDLFDGENHRMVGGKILNERLIVEKYDRLRKHPVLNLFRLVGVRNDLYELANHVKRRADANPNRATGRPGWGKFHRGYRFAQLVHRAEGQRFV